MLFIKYREKIPTFIEREKVFSRNFNCTLSKYFLNEYF